jgi:hypothetical protein
MSGRVDTTRPSIGRGRERDAMCSGMLKQSTVVAPRLCDRPGDALFWSRDR